jgi:hypothetical protein
MKYLTIILAALLLAACASYSGSGLKPGEAKQEDVLRVMGQPAMRWQEPDGTLQLAYPRGPMGVHSYMAFIGANGNLQRIENVMARSAFSRIQAGMSKAQVQRILGPSWPGWTVYIKARDELAWEWRYCDEWNEPARFDVLFDASKETVRSTLSQTESQMGLCKQGCWCSH